MQTRTLGAMPGTELPAQTLLDVIGNERRRLAILALDESETGDRMSYHALASRIVDREEAGSEEDEALAADKLVPALRAIHAPMLADYSIVKVRPGGEVEVLDHVHDLADVIYHLRAISGGERA